MVNAWTNFAKTGDPGMGWTPCKLNSDQQFWNISGPMPKMEGSREISDRMKLWEDVCLNNKNC